MERRRLQSANRLGLGDTRKNLRVPVQVDASVAGTSVRRHQGKLADISTAGCRVASPFTLEIGKAVVIRIADFEPMLAYVRWCSSSELGLEFRRVIDPRVVTKISDLAAPSAQLA